MKVIHVVESFAGGVYDFLVELTNNLTPIKYVIVHGKRENTPLNYKKDFPLTTKFIYWNNVVREINPLKDLKALIGLIKILKGIDADIIHLHSSKAGFIGRFAAKILGLQDKVIYTSHGASFLRKDVSLLKRNLFIYLEKVASKLGGKVIACSKSEAEVFHEYGINADYIYNGIKCKQFSRKKNLKGKDIITIGTIGRVTYPKNPKFFNKIAENFLQRRNIKFLWIGDGEFSYQLKSPNITLTGWLPREEVENKLQEIDIYLSTSLWEGLPLSVLQAMCAAKPLILSDCVGNRDLVVDNGKIFRTIEEAIISIIDLIENPKKREIWGLSSLKLVNEKFSIEKTVEKYKQLYQSLTEK